MDIRTSRDLIAAIAVTAAASANAQLDEVILIDISVVDQITITATSGVSAATVSGSDTTGFYFADFYTSSIGGGISETLVSGNLTSAANTSDGTPNLFRISTDPGLNVFSYTDDPTSDFTAGLQAFSGSATFTVPSDDYADLLGANTTGLVYFPADTADDIAGATAIGTYRVIPAPASAALLGLGGLAAVRRRR